MTKHTPAPWLIQVGNDGVNYIHIVKHGETHPYKIIAIVGNESEEHKANEKIILAAPEMLQALQVSLKLSDDCMDADKAAGYERERSPECKAVYNLVKAAIDKATI